jgi:hypothetical protein
MVFFITSDSSAKVISDQITPTSELRFPKRQSDGSGGGNTVLPWQDAIGCEVVNDMSQK